MQIIAQQIWQQKSPKVYTPGLKNKVKSKIEK